MNNSNEVMRKITEDEKYYSNYDAKEFGRRIREIRKKNNMTQEELAQRLMVSVDSISNYENGKTNCMHDYIMHLCEIFNVSADYFFFGKISYEQRYDETTDKILELLEESGKSDKERIYQMMRIFLNK